MILPETIGPLVVAQVHFNAVIKKGLPNYKYINDDSLIACFFSATVHSNCILSNQYFLTKVQFPALQPRCNPSTKNKHILQLGNKNYRQPQSSRRASPACYPSQEPLNSRTGVLFCYYCHCYHHLHTTKLKKTVASSF